jgi:hypothetical protein
VDSHQNPAEEFVESNEIELSSQEICQKIDRALKAQKLGVQRK